MKPLCIRLICLGSGTGDASPNLAHMNLQCESAKISQTESRKCTCNEFVTSGEVGWGGNGRTSSSLLLQVTRSGPADEDRMERMHKIKSFHLLINIGASFRESVLHYIQKQYVLHSMCIPLTIDGIIANHSCHGASIGGIDDLRDFQEFTVDSKSGKLTVHRRIPTLMTIHTLSKFSEAYPYIAEPSLSTANEVILRRRVTVLEVRCVDSLDYIGKNSEIRRLEREYFPDLDASITLLKWNSISSAECPETWAIFFDWSPSYLCSMLYIPEFMHIQSCSSSVREFMKSVPSLTLVIGEFIPNEDSLSNYEENLLHILGMTNCTKVFCLGIHCSIRHEELQRELDRIRNDWNRSMNDQRENNALL